MKVIALTAPQIAALAPLKAAETAACTAHQAAAAALRAELVIIATASGVVGRRLSLSDDGNSLVVEG